MKDNAKCAGNRCPVRETCARFVRPPYDQECITPDFSGWLMLNRRTGQLSLSMWAPTGGEEGRHICFDYVPIVAVQPHGGAREEMDGA